MNNQQSSKKSSHSSAATETASRVIIVLIAILIYVIVCSMTGAIVYAIYGWKGPGSGPDGNFITAVQGMAEIATQQFNVIPPTTTTTTTQIDPPYYINPCPPAIQLPCPALPTCQMTTGMECQPKLPTPPCYVLPAPNCQTCPSPPPCICQSMTPCPALPRPPEIKSIDEFTRGQRMSKTVSQWLNLYPPFSRNRLIVATTLLDDMIEPWALVGSIHRCTSSNNAANDTFKTTCHICQDRYDYIKCVVSSNLIEDQTLSSVARSNGWYNSDAEFTPMRGWLPDFVYQLWAQLRIDGVMARYQQEINAMTVRTTSGSSCRVCKDFNRNVYDYCLSRPPIRDVPV